MAPAMKKAAKNQPKPQSNKKRHAGDGGNAPVAEVAVAEQP